jgi:hypothetical protein
MHGMYGRISSPFLNDKNCLETPRIGAQGHSLRGVVVDGAVLNSARELVGV